MRNYLCIDVGGSAIKYAVIQEDGTFLKEGKTETCRDNLEHFTELLCTIYNKCKPVDGIAFSMPGVIDVQTGYLYTGGAITCCDDLNLKEHLQKFLGNIPITIENDAKAAAWAELDSGVLQDVRDAVLIVVGTGLGSTVIIDRKIIRGKDLFAGELSYIYYNVNQPIEINPEHIMTMRCVPARITSLYQEYTKQRKSCKDIFACANEDAYALQAIQEVARNLAMTIWNIHCVLNPEVFAIGGGISEQALFIHLVQEHLNDLCECNWPGAKPVKVVACKYHNQANLLGALYFHLHQQGG